MIWKKSVIKKLIKKVFQNTQPLEATTPARQESLLKQFKEEAPLLSIKKNTYSGKTYLYAEFYITLSSEYVNNLTFYLKFKNNQLYLTHREFDDQTLAYPAEGSELIALAAAIREAVVLEDKLYEQLEYASIKKDKIKTLKQTVILAKIKELVELEKVPYIVQKNFTTKIKIIIRLSADLRMEVDVPYHNYQIVLQNLHETILSIKALIEKGISPKIKSSVYENSRLKWTIP